MSCTQCGDPYHSSSDCNLIGPANAARCRFCSSYHDADKQCQQRKDYVEGIANRALERLKKSEDTGKRRAAAMKAHEFLEAGLGHMKDRAATYDAPQGERSMSKTVEMFRALTGIEMSEEQGWKFMCCLKMVRSEQGAFRADNFEDLAAYAGLAGESASGKT